MKYEVGQLVIGTVTNVKPYALFMEFEDGVNGLLHISEISDSFIRDIEKFGTKGDQLKVKIVSIDEKWGQSRAGGKSASCLRRCFSVASLAVSLLVMLTQCLACGVYN